MQSLSDPGPMRLVIKPPSRKSLRRVYRDMLKAGLLQRTSPEDMAYDAPCGTTHYDVSDLDLREQPKEGIDAEKPSA